MTPNAMRVELIYDLGCPNVESARSMLIKAFTRTGQSARWREWDRNAADCPDYARGFGSPTILVNGRDIADANAVEGSGACRVYTGDGGRLSPVPPLDAVCAALQAAPPAAPSQTRWQAVLASLPATGVALLPKLTCPLCFPAYAAILGAFGLEFFNYTPYLLPLTVVFLALALIVLARQIRRSRRFDVMLLGAAAALAVLAGRFYAESDWIAGGGIALLVAALFIGSRAREPGQLDCPSCAVDRKALQTPAHP